MGPSLENEPEPVSDTRHRRLITAPRPCGRADRRFDLGGGDGGIEDVGDGWYRVHLTAPIGGDVQLHRVRLFFRSEPHTAIANPLAFAGDGIAGVDVFGPQVDRRPLSEFATDTRPYLRTDEEPREVAFDRELDALISTESWGHDWGLAELDGYLVPAAPPPVGSGIQPIARRAEQVFHGGVPLRQELAFADLRPGSFMLDDGLGSQYGGDNFENDGSRQPGGCDTIKCFFYVVPPTGAGDALIEISEAGRLLYLNPITDWQIRGLTFEHASGVTELAGPGDPPPYLLPLNSAAVTLHNATNLELVENRAQWNNAGGIGIAGSGGSNNRIVLRRNTAHANGVQGEFLGAAGGFFVEGEVFTSNSWRAVRGQLVGAITSGAKYGANAGGTVTKIQVSDNYSHGFWLDYLNRDITVTGSTFERNGDAGVYLERNISDVTAPNIIDDNSFSGNRLGIRGLKSSWVEVTGNQFHDNQIALELFGTIELIGSEPAQTVDWTIEDNTVSASCPGDLFVDYEGTSAQWLDFQQTHQSSGNTWTHVEGSTECAFELHYVRTVEAFWECDWMTTPDCLLLPTSWCAPFPP